MINKTESAVQLFSKLSVEAQDVIIATLEVLVGEAKTPDRKSNNAKDCDDSDSIKKSQYMDDCRRSQCAIAPEEVVRISRRHRTITDCFLAMEIAELYRGKVYIPVDNTRRWNFACMIGAIWTGGYIAGVRSERAARKRKTD